jgi:LysR family transcriptional regulator, nod-box dependent transcriptional activator
MEEDMNLASIDLNLLVTLNAVLTEKHLTRAGEQLGLSQPSMSHALGRLRRMFDDELLIRIGREYELTPLATELLDPVRNILKEIELTIERRPHFDPARDERVFTVAASDYATYLVFQPALQHLQDEAPRVHLQVHPLRPRAREETEAGEIDMSIWPLEVGPDLPHEVLFTDRWVAVAWAGHSEVDGTISLDQFLALPHVAYGPGIGSLGILENRMLAEHPEETIAMSVESFFLLPFMLTRTRYIAVVHERLAKRLSHVSDIKILELDFKTEPITEAIYWHPRLTLDPGHRWLRELLMRSASEIDGLASTS